MTPQQKLDSIRRFSKAAVAMGEMHVRHADDEFNETGHSCYQEGWARGYRHAMEIMEQFILDTIKESQRA